MPAPLMSRPDLLARLMDLFREKGFDGASLSDIAESTGLGKSSLYHHFPDGKQEMGLKVLAHLEEQLETALFEPMQSADKPGKKLDRMLDALDSFYESGQKACLLERLCASVDAKVFRRPLSRVQQMDGSGRITWRGGGAAARGRLADAGQGHPLPG